MPASERNRYIGWFLDAAPHLMPPLELPTRLQAAGTLIEKWDALKWAGDVIVTALEKFPVPEQIRATSLAAIQREVEAQGIGWGSLINVLPLIIRIIRLIQEAAVADEWAPAAEL